MRPGALVFTVEASTTTSTAPTSLADAGPRKRSDLQDSVFAHPEILGAGVKVALSRSTAAGAVEEDHGADGADDGQVRRERRGVAVRPIAEGRPSPSPPWHSGGQWWRRRPAASEWPDRKPYFWLIDGGTVGTYIHRAFTVVTREEVTTLHGFVLDAHGINLEAVCHHPQGG